MSDVRFLSYVRRGIGAALPAAGAQPVAMQVAGETVQADVSLFGPGDVAGVDPRMILRREPAPGSASFAPNHLAYVDLAQPDFPWLLSRVAPDAHRNVAPWLCLVVLDADDGPPRTATPLPVVDVGVEKLPRLDEIATWAHVQVRGPFGPADTTSALLRDAPHRAIARIVAPRRLAPRQRYLACLVPTTAAGRKAGLGERPEAGDETRPAWQRAEPRVTLPVYDAWEFETGEPGDFESLARKLVPHDLRDVMAPRPIGIEAVAGQAEPHEVALPTPLAAAAEPSPWTGPSRDAATERLRGWLAETGGEGRPRLGPPLYGATQALPPDPADPDRTPSLPGAPGWLRDLNLDPRYRAVANLGAEIVRAHQDDWVAQAWRQLGDAAEADRLLNGAAFASVIGQRVQDKHLAALDPGDLLATARPALARLREGAIPIARRVEASRVGAGVLGGAYREVARVRGRLPTVGGIVEKRNEAAARLPSPPAIHGAVTVNAMAKRLETVPRDAVTRVNERTRLIRADLAAAARPPIRTEAVAAAPMLPLAELAQTVLSAMAPAVVARRRLRERIGAGAELSQVEELRPLRAAPEIPVPLADRLAAIDPRLMAPGVGRLPPNCVGYLRADTAAIEALLVGANHELARELSWRGVPVDLRATLLRRFWPLAAAPDIAALATWPAGAALGEAGVAAGTTPGTIVAVRGEIVRRFPDALYYLTRAVADGPSRKPSDAPQDFVAPLFRGRLTDDVLYIGFAAVPDALRGGPDGHGFYFVVQEHPGAARFGFDETPSATFETWMDLAWSQVPLDSGHVATAPPPPAPAVAGGLAWGRGAAQMAAVARRRTSRLSIHCRDLLP